MLKIGSQAPEFNALDQNGKDHKLADYAGRWLILYFYPKDNTPGCTTEACTFRDAYADFRKNNVAILGVSGDSQKSHLNFADKFSLPFPLLVDEGKTIIKAYGAGGFLKRISYLIDPQSRIAKAYEKVKPADHPAEILSDIAGLTAK